MQQFKEGVRIEALESKNSNSSKGDCFASFECLFIVFILQTTKNDYSAFRPFDSASQFNEVCWRNIDAHFLFVHMNGHSNVRPWEKWGKNITKA